MKEQLIQKLEKAISVLIDPDSELMQDAERVLDNEFLVAYATALNQAASSLLGAKRTVEEKGKDIIDTEGTDVTEQDIDDIAAIAQSLDESGDPRLMRTASIIDEILLTIGADPKAKGAFKKAEQEEIERLRAKYRETRGDKEYKDVKAQHDKEIKVNEAIEAVNKRIKQYRPLEAPLSTRYSPDMPGVSLVRIGDSVYQCPVTKKIYDFRAGYTTMKGNKIPGSEVSNQTQYMGHTAQEHMNFSTREQTLNKG